jgi:hypothetical protein
VRPPFTERGSPFDGSYQARRRRNVNSVRTHECLNESTASRVIGRLRTAVSVRRACIVCATLTRRH